MDRKSFRTNCLRHLLPSSARVFLSLALGLLLGCAGVTTVPLGAPVPLPSGPPQNPCEQEGFLEIIPAKAFVTGSTQTPAGAYTTVVTTVEETSEGAALYRYGTSEALMLPEILPQLGAPALASNHLRRIQPILDKQRRQKKWTRFAVTSAVVSLVGVGIFLGSLSSDSEEAIIAGGVLMGGGLIAELIGFAGAGANKPTAQEQTYVGLRRHLLLPGEDDLEAAAKSVDRYNTAVREGCR